MNEVTPWISDYFTNLATTYGSNYLAAPPMEKLRKCQLKKVLTPDPQDYCWVILSDIQYEVPGRIPKEVVEQCLKEAKRGDKITRHAGSLIDIRNFTPLFVRVEDGPSTSTTRQVLALEIKKAKLRGATRESIWGSPKPLDSVPGLKEWIRELRNPDGNQDILKIRKKQQDDAKVAKQFAEPSEHSPDVGLHLQPATYAPVAALRKADPTKPTVVERSPMQRYRRRWHKAVPGLDEFARRLQIPEDVRLKILEKQANNKAEAESRASGTVPMSRPPNVRGALEIGSSPPRLSPVPRATTPEEWPASPGGPKAIYDDHETEMSSDVDSPRLSSPAGVFQDAEMDEVEPQPEVIPETPQVPLDSQPRHLSPPPPAQPPRPRSPLLSSSNPQVQTDPNSSASIHTSIQAVSGSQLPSLEKPSTWGPLCDEPSGGPSFVLPWTQRDDPPVGVPKPNPEAHPSPEKRATEPPSPEKQATKPPGLIKESAPPAVSKPPQEAKASTKKPRALAFGESVFQAIELAFQQGGSEEIALTISDPAVALPTPKVTVAQVPPPKPRSKPPSKVMQSSLPGPSPSPLDRLAEANHTGSPVRRPFEVLNRKVPLPEVGPTREPVRGRNENGALTMVLIPASDETKVSSPLKQNSSSQPVQSSQSIPSSQRIPPSDRPPSSEPVSSSQVQHHAPQLDQSIAQDGDSIVVQVNETVANIEKVLDHTGNTQSSLEYASTQDENRVAVDAEPQNPVDEPPEVVVAMGGATGEPLTSPHPQIAVIREVESQQSIVVEDEEEVDELEDDSDVGDHRPVVKRKPKPTSSKSPSKQPKRSKLVERVPSPNGPSKPASLANSIAERAPSRSPLPPKPIVLIERKRTPAIPTDERAPTRQKRRFQTPPEEGFSMPRASKRSRIHGHHAAQATLSPIPRTPSPLPQEGQNFVVPNTSRSAKGKERAKGIKGLEKINTVENLQREEPEVVEVPVKKTVPDTGSKRKPSDAFSARDDSRDVKRQKVAEELERRKPKKQLSFVDPEKLKRPFRNPQVRKASPQRQATAATTVKPPAAVQPDKDGRTSKYFNPQFYREPDYPQVTTTTPEKEPPQRILGPKRDVGNKAAGRQNGRDPGELRPRNDSRKTSTLNSDRPARTQHPKPAKVKKDLAATEPTARKLGSFAPDLNPPSLPGFPGGRLMNKQLREILIRTGKVRVREAKAAESNRNG